MFKKAILLGSVSAISLLSSADAFAGDKMGSFFDKENWQIRVRSILVDPDESSTISDSTKANAKPSGQIPELDFTYFLDKNWATELILATSRHDMYSGNTDLGHVKILPPTLTLQYHFMPEETFRPYIGAGVNYTVFYDSKAGAGLGKVKYRNGMGYALQAGADYMLDDNWGINLDVKKVYLNTHVNAAYGAVTGDVDLDPWILGFGITYKF